MPLSKSEIENLLTKEEMCFLGTSTLSGNPHVKPIWFVYHNNKIWFETHEPSKAFRNIMSNNKVCINFGGKNTYIVWGTLKWYAEKDCPIEFRKLLWDKYGKDMDDSFIDDQTRIFEVIINKETSWHYAPTWE